MLQNFLISSRFNQELLRRREYIGFYKEILHEKRWLFDLMKIGWTTTIVRVGWATIPWRGLTFSCFFTCPILIGPSCCIHASPTIAEIVIESRTSDFHLTRSMVWFFAHAFDDDRVDYVLRDRCTLIKAISSNASCSATSPAIYDFAGT